MYCTYIHVLQWWCRKCNYIHVLLTTCIKCIVHTINVYMYNTPFKSFGVSQDWESDELRILLPSHHLCHLWYDMIQRGFYISTVSFFFCHRILQNSMSSQHAFHPSSNVLYITTVLLLHIITSCRHMYSTLHN